MLVDALVLIARTLKTFGALHWQVHLRLLSRGKRHSQINCNISLQSNANDPAMADTRRHILQTVREQAKLLQQAEALQQHPHLHIWKTQQWWESFQFLFVSSVSAADSVHHDDLLFFVKSSSHPTASNPPLFVRRKAKQLPEELQLSGKDFGKVDWAQTVLLNLVLQNHYQLTVVACGREQLPFVAEGRTWSPDMITVSKPVYASTTVTAVNLDSSRADASTPEPCFPDICFAVDNFDNAFENLVLENPSKCYCVVLHAVLDSYDKAAAEPYPDIQTMPTSASMTRQISNSSMTGQSTLQPQQQQASSAGASTNITVAHNSALAAGSADAAAAVHERTTDDSAEGASGSLLAWQIGTRRRTMFAGYVSYGQIVDFLDNNAKGKTLFDALLGFKAGQQDKVVMTGPGGVGRCEVAVTKLQQNSRSNTATPGSSQHSDSAAGDSVPRKISQGGGSSSSTQAAADGGAVQQPISVPQQSQQRRGFVQRGLQQARMLAAGVQQAMSDINSSTSSYNMMCALMLLKLPVSYLSRELLEMV